MFSRDDWSAFKLYSRISGLVDILVGVFVAAIHLNVLKRIARGEPVALQPVLRTAARLYPKLVQAGMLFSVRVGIRLLLLIVPGLQKGCALALTFPVAVFEERDGDPALLRSEILMQGHKSRLFRYGLSAILLYTFGYWGLVFFFPVTASPLGNAVESVPFNMMCSLWTIGICLFYADLTADFSLARPVGLPSPLRADYDEMEDRPRRSSILLAVIIAVTLLISGMYYASQQPYFDGERLSFGEAGHEIYYSESLGAHDAEVVARGCLETELFNQETPWILLLEKKENTYILNIIVAQDEWNDEALSRDLDLVQKKMRTLPLKFPVQLMLYDDWADKKRPVPR